MRVTRQLMQGVIATTLLVGVVNGAFRVMREERTMADDTRRDHDFVGRTLRSAWLDVYRMKGVAAADAMVRDADAAFAEVDLRVRDTGPCLAGEGDRAFVDDARFVSCYPLRAPDGVRRALVVSESMRPQWRYFRVSVARNMVISLITTAFVTGLIAVFGQRVIGRPILALREKARRVGAGDLGGPLRLERDDELGELAAELNAMCERLATARDTVEAQHRANLETQEQLRHADRLRTVGLLASGLAHELGTPLNVVLARAGLLADGDATRDEVVEGATVIAEQTRRMTRMIRQLLDFARHKRAEKAPGDLAATVERCASMMRATARQSGVAVDVRLAGEQRALFDADQIQQVLMNLVMNAIQAMPDGGALRLEVGAVDLAPPADVGGARRRWCFVAVDDEGVGIAPENSARVFEPFFTTKDVGAGTGLGLSISYAIARDHGGWIAHAPRAPRGSRFTLFIPAAQE